MIESIHRPELDRVAPVVQPMAPPPEPPHTHQDYDRFARMIQPLAMNVGSGTSSDAPPPGRPLGMDPATFNAHFYPDASRYLAPVYIVPVEHNRRSTST